MLYDRGFALVFDWLVPKRVLLKWMQDWNSAPVREKVQRFRAGVTKVGSSGVV